MLTSCYNSEKFVTEAINSILEQSFAEFEYVIVNDGSTDNTMALLREYASKDTRIVIIEKENTGLADSLNVGLKSCRGKWIARLDADDIAMPDRLSTQLDFVNTNKDVVLLGGGAVLINDHGNDLKEYCYPSQHNILLDHLKKKFAFFPHSTAFFDRARIIEIGGYNTRFLRSQDCDLWLRLGEVGNISCIQQPIIKLRKHGAMLSNTDQGKLQLIMGLSSRICHFRRILGMSDPSQQSDNIWRSFLDWVETQAELSGYIQYMNFRRHLSNLMHGVQRKEWLKQMLKCFESIFCCRKILCGALIKNSLPRKLAEKRKNDWS